MNASETQPAHPAPASPDPTFWIWIAALGTIAINILFADRRGFWLDEYITYDCIRLALPDLIADRIGSGHSPLHFMFAKLFLAVDNSERVLRLSSALPSGLAACMVMLIAARAGWQRAFPILALTCIFCPYWIETGTMFRYMMPLVCGGSLMLWSLYRHQLEPRLSAAVLVTLLTGLCLWIHFSAQFVVIGLLGFVIADTRARGVSGFVPLLRRLAPLLMGYALGLPFLYLIRHHKISNASQFLEPRSVIEGTTEAFFSQLSGWSDLLDVGSGVPIVLFIALLGSSVWFARRALSVTPEGATLGRMLVWSVLGTVSAILVIQLLGGRFILESRYVSALSPALVLSVGLALHTLLHDANARLRAWGVLLALSIAAQAFFAAFTHGDGQRDALRWVMDNNEHQDPVFITLTHYNRMSFRRNGYHGPLLGGLPTNEQNPAQVQAWMKSQWGENTRGMVMFYKSRADVGKALKEMIKAGEVVDAREWKFSGITRIYIYIRSEQDREWLEQFTPPGGLFRNVREKRLGPEPPQAE